MFLCQRGDWREHTEIPRNGTYARGRPSRPRVLRALPPCAATSVASSKQKTPPVCLGGRKEDDECVQNARRTETLRVTAPRSKDQEAEQGRLAAGCQVQRGEVLFSSSSSPTSSPSSPSGDYSLARHRGCAHGCKPERCRRSTARAAPKLSLFSLLCRAQKADAPSTCVSLGPTVRSAFGRRHGHRAAVSRLLCACLLWPGGSLGIQFRRFCLIHRLDTYNTGRKKKTSPHTSSFACRCSWSLAPRRQTRSACSASGGHCSCLPALGTPIDVGQSVSLPPLDLRAVWPDGWLA
jgi:hypothetical protein